MEVLCLLLFPTQILRVSFLSPMCLSITYLFFLDIPEQYTIAGWHVQTDEAREALKEMQHTHHVHHLKAYDMHGKLLWPCHYHKYLQDALVQVHFTLKHWSISGKNKTPCDTYAADIFLMCVLVPPATSGPVTPKKHKFLQTDPLTPDISAKKFKAFASLA